MTETAIIAVATLIVAVVTARLMHRAVQTLLGTRTVTMIGVAAWAVVNAGMAVL